MRIDILIGTYINQKQKYSLLPYLNEMVACKMNEILPLNLLPNIIKSLNITVLLFMFPKIPSGRI